MLKVNNNTSEWRRSGAFIVNFQHISHLIAALSLITKIVIM